MTHVARNTFTTIRTEGALLPSDLLRRIADGASGIDGLTAESYHHPGERLNEAINRSWNALQGAWANFKAGQEKLAPTDQGTTLTRERWLLPLFRELEYGWLQTATAEVIEGRSYPISHRAGNVPVHLVSFRLDLDRRTPGVAGAATASPHSLVQVYLNRSPSALWGFVSNGRQLRILRDNASLTRQAYVEFDLQSMMDGEVYSDFVLLWLVCHQSRLEGERPSDGWLEKWMRLAEQQGTRARDQLRDGVQRAIEALGEGFLAHPRNTALRDRLRSGALDKGDYYRQLLRLVYRLLFLFVAEDRELLYDPNATEEARAIYREHYSTVRLRRIAGRLKGTRHADLYEALRRVMRLLGGANNGDAALLGLPALGSFLFSDEAVADVIECAIDNAALLDAVRALAFIEDKAVRALRPVDYRNLGAEELGSIYESLLELKPELNADAHTFALSTVAGNERKTTGSYYTPTSLINALLESALDPVIVEARGKAEPESALLALKICDPACGSGHFLIAAANRLAKAVASARTHEEEPPPAAIQAAKRDVIAHCIYGVDLNPMAVELCKVNLWLESLEPGRPLSFLDHRIQCGNSLLGTTPRLLADGLPEGAFQPIEGDDKKFTSNLRKQNEKERKQDYLFQVEAGLDAGYAHLAADTLALDALDDNSLAGVRQKEARFQQLAASEAYRKTRLAADAWCAAFVWHKKPGAPPPVTNFWLRQLSAMPDDAPPGMLPEIARLAELYHFFHWHIAFPDVFGAGDEEGPEHEQTGWNGGFDCVLGNPPWERVKLQEREWFAAIAPEIANAQTAAVRRELIAALEQTSPHIFIEFGQARRVAEAEASFVQNSQRYPLSAVGDTNTYALFVELATTLVSESGYTGLIVKTGILADYSMRHLFGHLVTKRHLVSAHDFSNRHLIFPAVVANERFTLLTTFGGKWEEDFGISILNDLVSDIVVPGSVWYLNSDDIRRINPNTLTSPLFQSERDAQIVRLVYADVPVLILESDNQVLKNDFQCAYFTMFHMTNDSDKFVDLETLQSRTEQNPSPVWRMSDGTFLALYEGKLFDFYDYRFGDFLGIPRNVRFGVKAEPNHPTDEQKRNPDRQSLPRYWVPQEDVTQRYLGFGLPSGVLMFRDVCRTHTDLRTVRACIAPPWGAGNKAPMLLFPDLEKPEQSRRTTLLCANLNAIPLDYIARQKFAGGSLNRFILIQFPFIPLSTYTPDLLAFITPRALELTYTAWDLQAFAQDVGYGGPPFVWDEDRRFLMRCELDALYFHLYQISRDDADYILDTFPIVRRKDEAAHGEYRTKRIILEMYDHMAALPRVSVPPPKGEGEYLVPDVSKYVTWLTPPPADPRVAHPNTRAK